MNMDLVRTIYKVYFYDGIRVNQENVFFHTALVGFTEESRHIIDFIIISYWQMICLAV